MFGDFSDFGGGVFYDEYGNQLGNALSGIAVNNPVYSLGSAIMVVGIIVIIAGVVIAVLLKKKQR